jgi:hypothetical protein
MGLLLLTQVRREWLPQQRCAVHAVGGVHARDSGCCFCGDHGRLMLPTFVQDCLLVL